MSFFAEPGASRIRDLFILNPDHFKQSCLQVVHLHMSNCHLSVQRGVVDSQAAMTYYKSTNHSKYSETDCLLWGFL